MTASKTTILLGTIAALAFLSNPAHAQEPVPISPANSTATACPTFSWAAPEAGPGYEIVVYRVEADGTFTAEPAVRTSLPAGAESWTPPTTSCLEPGGKYGWSVRGVGAAAAEWSEPVLFEVEALPSDEEVRAAMATLRRHLAGRREGSDESGPAAPRGIATARVGTRQPTDESPAVLQSERKHLDAPLTNQTLSPGDITASAAPSLGDASLSIDGQLHLGDASAVFKNDELFLWGDSVNLGVGRNAMAMNTSGLGNTAVGQDSLYLNQEGSFNTGLGRGVLGDNTNGNHNTAVGFQALIHPNSSFLNTAIGSQAMGGLTFGAVSSVAIGPKALYHSTGVENTAVGIYAHRGYGPATTGFNNVAVGSDALREIDSGSYNTAVGFQAMSAGSPMTGVRNVAVGSNALLFATSGWNNVAVGGRALRGLETGSKNIAIGNWAGYDIDADESNAILIGHEGSTSDADDSTTRIGTEGTQTRAFVAGVHSATLAGSGEHAVCVDDLGQLGACTPSSERFKQDVAPLTDIAALLDLEPVTFRYRDGIHGGPDTVQVGLLAEQVSEHFPALVTRDKQGQLLGVRYDLLSVLLLKELRDQHDLVTDQRKELYALLRRVEALETGKPPPVGSKRTWWQRLTGRRADRG